LVNSLTPLSISVPANLVRTYGLDGWCAGLTAAAVGCQRRLALVELLPEAIRQQVREGQIAAHVAMKFLVPVARVSLEDCQRVAAAVRELEMVAAIVNRASRRLAGMNRGQCDDVLGRSSAFKTVLTLPARAENNLPKSYPGRSGERQSPLVQHRADLGARPAAAWALG
jgi:hypothetical protein